MSPTSSLTLIAQSAVMRELLEHVDTVSRSDSSVLLVGETGVGKELFAEYIHKKSTRESFPFVKVGLASLPAELLESELFGHEKGAYTGAGTEKKGLFELAEAGSIFLDDIDDFPVHLQSKLLRILESRELMRVGGTAPIPVNVRVICASKIDLKVLVDKNLFRSDLYYRINVVPIHIPPLRLRRDDIPLLITHFLHRFIPSHGVEVTDEAMQILRSYDWPGNIRELRNVVQRMAIFANGSITPKNLPSEIHSSSSLESILKACNKCLVEEKMSFEEVVHCLEMNLVKQALLKADGNRTQAAKILNLSPSTLRDKLKKFNLED
ncbi:MAG: sigma-54 dependent transcriptional regulator [Bacteriovoracaceae bacterium]|nr:sigma-54 dependent transcriptional regulator [Bacteroidota bacterium]